MARDDLDRLLIDDDDVAPSSGFAASVMDAIQREASAPPPIPFPWQRALPGLIATSVALALMMWSGFGALHASADSASVGSASLLVLGAKVMAMPEVAWLAFATIVTVIPAMLSLRVMRGST